jgi:hypothetical protein
MKKNYNSNKFFSFVTLFILIFILGLPIINAIDYKDLNNSESSENLPDYIVTSIGYGSDGFPDNWFYFVEVKNIGDAPGGWQVDADVIWYKSHLFRPDVKLGSALSWSNYNLKPGETRRVIFSWEGLDNHPSYGFERYECQLNCSFEEKSTDNNYFEKTYLNFFIWFIPFPYTF